MKKHTTVYVPVPMEFKAILNDNPTLKDYLITACHKDNDTYTSSHTFLIKDEKIIAQDLLTPISNAIVLTEEDLLELKKKVAIDAWDACRYLTERDGVFANKESYINNLTI